MAARTESQMVGYSRGFLSFPRPLAGDLSTERDPRHRGRLQLKTLGGTEARPCMASPLQEASRKRYDAMALPALSWPAGVVAV